MTEGSISLRAEVNSKNQSLQVKSSFNLYSWTVLQKLCPCPVQTLATPLELRAHALHGMQQMAGAEIEHLWMCWSVTKPTSIQPSHGFQFAISKAYL